MLLSGMHRHMLLHGRFGLILICSIRQNGGMISETKKDLTSLLLSGSLWVDMWDRLMRNFTQTK